ncbi:hypothetical protein DFS34DRAFT_371598 [Phlyctochytrium arcticum]|nr:hypothetical protein DFS34DRAFT_371598 [Phlyctochytrium arcticum]
MPAITPAHLAKLQKNERWIRNICILAHVDHGKTTLSDSLLASNGIISSKLSGKVRYLDSRADEQQRGITMKSSGISLYFNILKAASNSQVEEEAYLINLIDSPGHVDFSSEVSTASRLCDGGLVLVDSVEGVCTQTHTVLRQAWTEKVQPILVLNKIDRLITELKLTAAEAYVHLGRIVEQVNAIMGTFYSESTMQSDAERFEAFQKSRKDANKEGEENEDLLWQLEHKDDSTLYFSPEQGNVIFASAIDGWAFRIDQFAELYSAKLGIKEDLLRKVLWGDYYLDVKTKRILTYKGLKGRALKPMFVQFVLDNIWTLYHTILETNDREKVEKIVKALNVKVLPRDLRSKDSRGLLQTVMGQWLPLSKAVLLTVIEKIPAPSAAQQVRLPPILHPKGEIPPLDALSPEDAHLEKALYTCDAGEDAPTIVYVSKMFSVTPDMLPTKSRTPLTVEEMAERRKAALERHQQRQQLATLSSEMAPSDSLPSTINLQTAQDSSSGQTHTAPSSTYDNADEPKGETLVGFARIYSGTIRVGQKLYVLGPKYNPAAPELHRTEIVVESLYLMMGRELQALQEVPAGNVFGIGGLGEHILKTGTLSSTLSCPSFGSVSTSASPIVRVALEPVNANEMQQLVEGLRQLNQADPCVEVLLQDSGEHVIVCAGELHLERCLTDLRERFAKIDIQASPPIVPFRETISTSPASIAQQQQQPQASILQHDLDGGNSDIEDEKTPKSTLPIGTVLVQTPNKLCSMRIRAVPLPTRLAVFLEEKGKILRSLVEGSEDLSFDKLREGPKLLAELDATLEEIVKDEDRKDMEVWRDAFKNLWTFGPKRNGPNLLINKIPGYERQPWSELLTSRSGRSRTRSEAVDNSSPNEEDDLSDGFVSQEQRSNRIPTIRQFEGSIDAGFQLATLQGPLCGEPLMGVAFYLESFTILGWEEATAAQTSLLSGQIISTIKDGCRQAFMSYSPRLMLAMYSCDLQAPSEVLGKVYAVLARRRGRIISEEMREGTPFFEIKSMLPVVESFGFSDDIRTRTSGAASPQLIFKGFEVLDIDPFWVPSTTEELEDLGEKADRENLARKYMDDVRKRKGLLVERKIVEHAEKQRTLKK